MDGTPDPDPGQTGPRLSRRQVLGGAAGLAVGAAGAWAAVALSRTGAGPVPGGTTTGVGTTAPTTPPFTATGSPTPSATTPTTTPAPTTTATPTTDHPSPTRTPRPEAGDRSAVARAVRGVIGDEENIGLTVLDRRTGVFWSTEGEDLVETGSVVKVLIASAALRDARRAGRSWSAGDRDRMRRMITESDNDAADLFYQRIGGPAAVADLAADLRMEATAAARQPVHWGQTLSNPDDLVTMMQAIAVGSKATHRDDDRWLLDQMGRVVDGQRWGTGTVRRPGVRVRVKNGWMAVGEPWVINSVGDVRGNGRDYVLAMMQRRQPDEETGMTRASQLGRAVYDALADPLRAA